MSQAYLDGSLELEEDGLGDENLTSLGAEVANLRLEELDLLSGAAASDLEESIDYRVEIDIVLVGHCEGALWQATARSVWRGGVCRCGATGPGVEDKGARGHGSLPCLTGGGVFAVTSRGGVSSKQ